MIMFCILHIYKHFIERETHIIHSAISIYNILLAAQKQNIETGIHLSRKVVDTYFVRR